MNLWAFIIHLGIINIVFGFVWKWLFLLPLSLLLLVFKAEKGLRLVKIFGSYLLAALTAILTIIAVNPPTLWKIIFYPLTGAYVLLISYASNRYEAEKAAATEMNWQLMNKLRADADFDILLTLGTIIGYLIMLFVPVLAFNGLTSWLFGIVEWSLNLPVIGILLAIFGVLFLLSTGLQVLWSLGLLTAHIKSLLKKKVGSRP